MKFYLVPDFGRAAEVGIGNVIVAAMNQSFFTLSLGIAAMKSSAAICPTPTACCPARPCGSAAWTPCGLDVSMIIFPACFSFGLEPGQGPSLIL